MPHHSNKRSRGLNRTSDRKMRIISRANMSRSNKIRHKSISKANIKAKADLCKRFIYNYSDYQLSDNTNYRTIKRLQIYTSWQKATTHSNLARFSSTCEKNENEIYHAS